jgi:hypothetical protein
MERVLQMLVDLDGEATSRDLLERARKLWPNETLHQYAGSATCTRLLKWRFVELLPVPPNAMAAGPRIWRITPAGRTWLERQSNGPVGGSAGPARAREASNA